MPKFRSPKSLLWLAVCVAFVSGLVGCAPPQELVTANEAIEKARQEGKDKECPDEFHAAENMKNEAYAICQPCDTKKAIELANQALAKTQALCPAKPVVVAEKPAPPPVAPAPAPSASVSVSASPSTVQQGQCAMLNWTTSNASSVTIDQGVGAVDANGSRRVCPDHTTSYGVTASGPGGSRSASTTVTVNKVVDRLTLHVNFDFNKATIRKADDADLKKAIAFIQKYSGSQISLVGYTDSIGSDKYNLKLSEKRAEAVKDYLVKHGAQASRIQTEGRGKADPIGDNKTEKGRAENRRVEVLILSEAT